MNLTESEIFQNVFNRDLTENLIKNNQIDAAYQSWIVDFLNDDFIKDLEENEDEQYDTFIDDYIKPIWSWGVFYNNFNYLMFNFTDKGLIQLVAEGTHTFLSRDDKTAAKYEIRNNIHKLIQIMDRYCKSEKEKENPLFKNYTELKLKVGLPMFFERKPVNQIRY